MAPRCRCLLVAVLVSVATQRAAAAEIVIETERTVRISKGGINLPNLHVDCGGHYAETCDVCMQGHGHVWCNGDCTYVFGDCEYTTPWVWFKKQINNLIDFYFYLLWLWWMHIPCVILFGIGMTIYAVIFRNKIVNEYPEDAIPCRDVDYDHWVDRELGLFAVFKMPNTCLWAFFCTPVLAAKNFEVGKSMGYWWSFSIMFLMYTPLAIFAVIMRATMSNKLLRNLRIQPNWCEQFWTGCCCMCCAIGRESLEVDLETDMTIGCPFKAEHEPGFVEENVDKVRNCGSRFCVQRKWGGFFTKKEDDEHHGGFFGRTDDEHHGYKSWFGTSRE